MKSYQVSNVNSQMDELLKSNPIAIKQLKIADLVNGIVVEVSKDQILVDIGSKSEGIVPKEEFTENHELEKALKIGDSIVCLVVQPEDKQGYAILSLRKAEKEKTWRDLENAFRDLRRDVLFAFDREGRCARQKLVGQDSQTPPIDSLNIRKLRLKKTRKINHHENTIFESIQWRFHLDFVS